MYRVTKTAALAALLAVGLVESTGAQLHGEWMADNLATGCTPMSLDLTLYGEAEGNERLRKNLRNAAESRLRTAGVYDINGWEEHRQSLDIRVGTNGVASSMELILYRFVMDTGYGQAGPVLAWEWGTIGVHGGGQDILNTVSEGLDQFITEYLRANPTCGR